MLLVERHYIKGTPEIIRLCTLSKELYNRCNYMMRQAWYNQQHLKFKKLPDINELIREVKNLDCFVNFHNTKTAKQTIWMVLSDWSNFRKARTAYFKDPSKFIKFPQPPGYKEHLAQVIFYRETIKGGLSNKPLTSLTPTNNLFTVPYKENYKQIVVTPKKFGFIVDVQYEVKNQPKPKLDKNKVCTIDIGLNNLCAITHDQNRPILVNGRIIKSINQWYNKNPCKNRLRKRYFRLENYFHHVSKFIINLCVKSKIGRLIIGKNDGWKQNINLGRKTNQNFCFIPISSLLQKIKYKAEIVGIDVTFTEESYTSQASFYDNDPLPAYGQTVPEFSGKRKHRGLYVTKYGFAINADINGSLNIGRKVIPEFVGIGDRSIAAMPVTINPLKVRW